MQLSSWCLFCCWGVVWAERRAVNLVLDAFHVSDDGKFICYWSTCEVLVVIILIVTEAKVKSKETVRGLMFSLLPLPISLVTLILNNLISISLKGLQHFGVLYRSIVNWGWEPPLIVTCLRTWSLSLGKYIIKSDLVKFFDWQALAAELKEALQRKEASWAQSNFGVVECRTCRISKEVVWHSVTLLLTACVV